MKLAILSDEELLRLASHQSEVFDTIRQEWINRYHLQFPYKLVSGNIYNTILEKVIEDENSDRLVVEKANIIRSKQRKLDQ